MFGWTYTDIGLSIFWGAVALFIGVPIATDWLEVREIRQRWSISTEVDDVRVTVGEWWIRKESDTGDESYILAQHVQDDSGTTVAGFETTCHAPRFPHFTFYVNVALERTGILRAIAAEDADAYNKSREQADLTDDITAVTFRVDDNPAYLASSGPYRSEWSPEMTAIRAENIKVWGYEPERLSIILEQEQATELRSGYTLHVTVTTATHQYFYRYMLSHFDQLYDELMQLCWHD